MIHLLIIDAMNLIRRIYAVQSQSGLLVCEQALMQILNHAQPTHAVTVFDEDDRSHSWRHQLLPGYKAGRSEMPEVVRQELPLLREMFARHGIRHGIPKGMRRMISPPHWRTKSVRRDTE